MKRFKNILVIPSTFAGNDVALQRAARLADNNAARLTVLWPLEQSHDGGTGLEYMPDVVRAVETALEEAVAPVRGMGLQVDTRVRVGRPFLEIIRQVLECGHDLVMKTARGREVRSSLLFGTTALHLLRKCPCAVWVVHPEHGTRSGVLAAVDPDPEDEKSYQLNRTIMQLATSLAFLEDTDVHVVHAWSVPHEEMIYHSPFLRVSRSDASAYVQEIESRHRERFSALIEEFRARFPGMQVHFEKGSPDDVIPAVARRLNVDVVVMATLARTGIPGMLIGNTAESVLNEIDCSALTIKPIGFVSPVAAALSATAPEAASS